MVRPSPAVERSAVPREPEQCAGQLSRSRRGMHGNLQQRRRGLHTGRQSLRPDWRPDRLFAADAVQCARATSSRSTETNSHSFKQTLRTARIRSRRPVQTQPSRRKDSSARRDCDSRIHPSPTLMPLSLSPRIRGTRSYTRRTWPTRTPACSQMRISTSSRRRRCIHVSSGSSLAITSECDAKRRRWLVFLKTMRFRHRMSDWGRIPRGQCARYSLRRYQCGQLKRSMSKGSGSTDNGSLLMSAARSSPVIAARVNPRCW